MFRKQLLCFFFAGCAAFSLAQKKVLDASAYDIWKSVQRTTLSDNGKWVAYAITPQDGDAIVEVKSTDGSKTYTVERAGAMRFSSDGKFFVATVVPKREDVKKATRAKAKPEDQPKNELAILNLETGQRTNLDRITSFSAAKVDTGWILYKPEPPKPGTPKPATDTKPVAEGAKPAEPAKSDKKSDHRPGDVWMLRQLEGGKEIKLENIVATRWSEDGTMLIEVLSTPDGTGDGIVMLDIATGAKKPVVTGLGRYPKLAFSDKTKDIAFVTDKDDYKAKKPTLSIYAFRAADGKLTKVNLAKLPKGFAPSTAGSFQFSDKGSRLIFATAPIAEEEKKDETPEDEKVSVDIWNWQDPQMMPQQLLQVATERGRTYDAAYDVSTGDVLQLEGPAMRNATIGGQGDGDYALGSTNEPYARESSWGDGKTDYSIIEMRTGKVTPLITGFVGNLTMSPNGRYVYGYAGDTKEFVAYDPKSLKRWSLSRGIKATIWDEDDDHPGVPASYGVAGWTANDAAILIYDRYDIWQVDASSGDARNLTKGAGRSSNTVLRYVRTDPDQDFIDLSKPMLLDATNERTKASGFSRLSNGNVERLILEDKNFSAPIKATKADIFAYQRSDFNEAPDVWLADVNFANARRMSDGNPQQKEYNWCTAELVSWMSNDGQMLQGVLYKPENFDPAKKYPMISYFYERYSQNLHQYSSIAPSASIINIPMYCSNGYIVFVPDIPYKVGYPGESALSAILPGVQSIVARGFVDPKRLGLQGHSWGGYQIGYMVTETNMFAAACAGAPVANMISAYGGIRWGSGVSREGQYESGQSRIGFNLWESPLRYIENSPIFFVDKIKTPLLMMANDKDGAVPWYQGIEFFSALRRLNKPAWLVVYNEEDHNLVQRKNRKDWSIRLQQFFDHYLKGAPMPVWMANGVPATQKGKTYGFDLVPGTEKRAGGN